jgi:hypothetical protein
VIQTRIVVGDFRLRIIGVSNRTSTTCPCGTNKATDGYAVSRSLSTRSRRCTGTASGNTTNSCSPESRSTTRLEISTFTTGQAASNPPISRSGGRVHRALEAVEYQQQRPFLQVQRHLLERRPLARLAHADDPGDRERDESGIIDRVEPGGRVPGGGDMACSGRPDRRTLGGSG